MFSMRLHWWRHLKGEYMGVDPAPLPTDVRRS